MRRSILLRGPAFLIAGMCLALLFFGVANAQLSKQDQKCVNSVNKGAAKVAKAQGGDNSACIKNGGKGKLPLGQSIEECIVSDPKGKVAKAISKIKTADCGTAPAFPPILTDAGSIGDLMVGKELALIHALFGTDLDQSIVPCATNKDQCKCQQAVAKAAQKCQDTKLKVYNACKKNALKVGKEPLTGGAQSEGELQDACLGTGTESIPDPKNKISGKCADFDIAKKCSGQNLDVMIPGCAPGSNAVCVDQKIECQVCLALNALDGLDRDCDLFDDGQANISCGGLIGGHTCVVDPDPNASSLTFITHIIARPYSVSGALDIICGSAGANGKAPCDCQLQYLDPIWTIGMGYICLSPAAGSCPTGEIDCDGGNPLDVDMESDHNIGTCIGNADCAAQCGAHCGVATVFDSGCEGFCEGGANNDVPCTDDSDCPGGACNGRSHLNICGCECLTVGGAPGVPGALQCNMPVEINVEIGTPCGDGDIVIAGGTRCIPLTTAEATSQIHNANNSPGNDLPAPGFVAVGNGISCSTLSWSVSTGLNLVGAVNFFDSEAGDLQYQLNFSCL